MKDRGLRHAASAQRMDFGSRYSYIYYACQIKLYYIISSRGEVTFVYAGIAGRGEELQDRHAI
eukprot:scaffold585238_cov33-Prasinocladus_malaysianus.AAC.1